MEYNIKQAAERLKKSENTIRNYIKKGEIKAYKKDGPYGPEWKIPEEELNHAAALITEVAEVKQSITRDELVGVFKEAVREENKDLYSAIVEENKELRKQVKELQAALEKERQKT